MKPLLFGKYCLLERVSVGGMAEVFRAKPFDAPDFRGYLALKRILPHLAEDEEFIKMFVDEAKLTVQLNHPNIVRIYELGQFQNSYYILMEFISGKDVLALQKTMRRQRDIMPVDMSMFIAREMARGLHYAHHKRDPDGNPLNIIHRDVSPQNVLIDYRGRVKVIDFGIAKAEVQSTRTAIGVLKGKMGYMSPEQVRGEVLDYRSDVFAIGTVLWEMLTNRRLFHGENEFDTMQKVRDAVADPPSTRNPFVTPEVDQIVMGAITRDPEDRYESAAAFADRIDEWLQSNPYSDEDLSVWMRTIFADDLDDERAKRDEFATIVSPDDVLRLQEAAMAPAEPAFDPEPDTVPKAQPIDPALVAPVGLGEASAAEWASPEQPETVDQPESEGIWVGEAPAEGQDIAEFADQHTTVAAGGFDASEAADDSEEFETWRDQDADDLKDAIQAVKGGVPEQQSEQATLPGALPAVTIDSAPPTTQPPTQQPVGQPVGQPPAQQHTATEFQSVDTNTQHAAPPQPGPPKWLWAVGLLSVLLLLGGVGAAAVVALQGDPPPPPPQLGGIAFDITPADGIEIVVDGSVVATASPFTMNDVATGPHKIEVRHPDFEPLSQSVNVQPTQVAQLTVSLEPTATPNGFVTLRFPDGSEGVTVFVDGKKQDEASKSASFELPAGKHLFEALKDGAKPWATIIDLQPRVRVEELVKFDPIGLSLEITAGKTSSVRFGSQRLGRGVVTATEIDPRTIERLSVTYRGQGVSDWSSYEALPRLASGSIEVDFDKKLPPRYRKGSYGYLQISTGSDWWEVLVDGHEIGLVTPIDARNKLPILAGKHKLTFRRGGQTQDHEIEIEKGETFLWRKKLPFSYTP